MTDVDKISIAQLSCGARQRCTGRTMQLTNTWRGSSLHARQTTYRRELWARYTGQPVRERDRERGTRQMCMFYFQLVPQKTSLVRRDKRRVEPGVRSVKQISGWHEVILHTYTHTHISSLPARQRRLTGRGAVVHGLSQRGTGSTWPVSRHGGSVETLPRLARHAGSLGQH